MDFLEKPINRLINVNQRNEFWWIILYFLSLQGTGTNFIFLWPKFLLFVDEIFRWKTPSMTKFYFIKENLGPRNKIFVTKLLTTSLERRTRHERIFLGECFCKRNLDFQWQNILSLKVNFLVVIQALNIY